MPVKLITVVTVLLSIAVFVAISNYTEGLLVIHAFIKPSDSGFPGAYYWDPIDAPKWMRRELGHWSMSKWVEPSLGDVPPGFLDGAQRDDILYKVNVRNTLIDIGYVSLEYKRGSGVHRSLAVDRTRYFIALGALSLSPLLVWLIVGMAVLTITRTQTRASSLA